jgi:hypothetical protein
MLSLPICGIEEFAVKFCGVCSPPYFWLLLSYSSVFSRHFIIYFWFFIFKHFLKIMNVSSTSPVGFKDITKYVIIKLCSVYIVMNY